ncbi:MAG TPA: type II toxin-antitoxin system prevent-host-death family antitoxin [Gemmatimonadales bacterium]|nr:type II toxin-antitoxin system prevent-host-death family antitoxin [Gemmatimonadales bacterium]
MTIIAAGIAELKASLSEYLARVKAGEEVVVTERGRPIARIVPLAGADALEARTAALIAQGRIRPAEEPMDDAFLELPRAEDPKGAVLAALLAEREEGR